MGNCPQPPNSIALLLSAPSWLAKGCRGVERCPASPAAWSLAFAAGHPPSIAPIPEGLRARGEPQGPGLDLIANCWIPLVQGGLVRAGGPLGLGMGGHWQLKPACGRAVGKSHGFPGKWRCKPAPIPSLGLLQGRSNPPSPLGAWGTLAPALIILLTQQPGFIPQPWEPSGLCPLIKQPIRSLPVQTGQEQTIVPPPRFRAARPCLPNWSWVLRSWGRVGRACSEDGELPMWTRVQERVNVVHIATGCPGSQA